MKTSKLIPAVVLVLLLIAWFTRWDYVASKTFNDGVVRWKVDRWTGYRWLDFYSISYIGVKSGEAPAYDSPKPRNAASKARKIATNVWYGLIAADCVWMIVVWLVLPVIKRRGEEKTSPPLS